MPSTNRSFIALSLASILMAPSAHAAPEMPAECETATGLYDKLFSFFGGVASYAVTQSATTVHSGDSMQLDIAFQPTPFFGVSGVGIGTLGVSAPELAASPSADTWSMTIDAPTDASLSVFVTIREDDNNDGIINIDLGDDEWESPLLMLSPGTNVYNIPVASFVDTGFGSGNGLQNFTTVNRLAFFLTIESRTSYPGGLVTTPKTLWIDHVGLYAGSQSLPSTCDGDVNADAVVDVNDISFVIFRLGDPCGATGCDADANSDGAIDVNDISFVLFRLGQPC